GYEEHSAGISAAIYRIRHSVEIILSTMLHAQRKGSTVAIPCIPEEVIGVLEDGAARIGREVKRLLKQIRVDRIGQEAKAEGGTQDFPGLSDRDAPRPDGPGPDRLVWYKNNCRRFPKVLYDLLVFLWPPNRPPKEKVSVRDAVLTVWGDKELDDPI